jgi:signal transduction histidine kinase
MFIVPFMVLFALDLYGREDWLKPLPVVALFTPFFVWTAVIWSDMRFHLVYQSLVLHRDVLISTRTVYATVFQLLCFSILAGCVYYLARYFRTVRTDIRNGALWVIILGSFLVVLEILKLTMTDWKAWLLPMSVYFGFIGVLMLAMVYKYKLFSIVPIARDLVIDTIGEGVLIVDHKGRVVDANEPIRMLLQVPSQSELLNSDIVALLDAWPDWMKLCQRMEQGHTEVYTTVYDEQKVFAVHVSPLNHKRRQGLGSVSVLTDITDKQRRLEHIAHLNHLKDQLFTIVSHDIRGPLDLQLQLVHLLEEDQGSFRSEHQDVVVALGQQVRNTFNMVDNLLEWFRSQREGMVLQPRVLPLAQFVEECCLMLQASNAVKEVVIHREIEESIHVYADWNAASLILRNLLTNAVKFSRLGGNIYIRAQESEDSVIIVVMDEGVGMSEDRLRRLFNTDAFDTSLGTAGERGAGLGLQVCKQFVQLSGGQLWAASVEGQGSSFYFTLRNGGRI